MVGRVTGATHNSQEQQCNIIWLLVLASQQSVRKIYSKILWHQSLDICVDTCIDRKHKQHARAHVNHTCVLTCMGHMFSQDTWNDFCEKLCKHMCQIHASAQYFQWRHMSDTCVEHRYQTRVLMWKLWDTHSFISFIILAYASKNLILANNSILRLWVR